LFVRHDESTWAGYTYQWDEAQTEATIVPDSRRDVMFNTGTRTVPWQYPNRLDCTKCHDSRGGSTLGPETRQMNRVVGGMNQIDKLNALGLFDKPIAAPYPEAYIAPYPSQAGTPPANATVEQRARSYLQANCAFCHRPDGELPPIDLRYDTAFVDTKLCNTAPAKGNQGVTDAVNLKPGDPSKSIMYLRMAAMTGQGRMPAVATNQVDDAGLKLIGDWITSIKSCTP
jgi:mono/diheme cytochrome c family protein